MWSHFISSAALVSFVSSSHALLDQQPLTLQLGLIQELKHAGIIPAVLDEFTPLVSLNITWSKAAADIGNTIKPKKMKKSPNIGVVDRMPEMSTLYPDVPQLTLALTDPDAPSRDDPEWSQFCHWITTGIELDSEYDSYRRTKEPTLREVMPYKPPGPPKKTGPHRYIFVALSPKNGTTERLNLTKPADRQRWGYQKAGAGIREWAEENGLGVVGANFVYSKHKKQ